jgi:Uma2 family endonuclease
MTDSPKEKIRMTVAEYMALPESNLHTELINGELIVHEGKEGMSPAPKDIHQRISFIISAYLLQFFPAHELRTAPTDVHFDDGNIVQPDVFWVSTESGQCVLHDDGYLHGAPDFVIEILSPTTTKHDRGTKFDLYQKQGVREYWMIEPEGRFVEVYRLEESRFVRQGLFEDGQSFASTILGEKSVNVAALLGEQK